MSKAAREFFDSIKQGEPLGAIRAGVKDLAEMLPGLNNIVQDVGTELKRLGVQGQMELASALFTGNAFVPYGPGQYTPAADKAPPEQEQERHHAGREM